MIKKIENNLLISDYIPLQIMQFIRLSQLFIWVNFIIVIYGHLFNIEIMTKMFFESMPIQTPTTLVGFIFIERIINGLLPNYENNLKSRYEYATSLLWLSFISFFMNINDPIDKWGIESLLGYSAIASSQTTVLCFICVALAFMVRYTFLDFLQFFFLCIIFCISIISIIGLLTGLDYMYSNVEGYSYGVALNTAILLLISSLVFLLISGSRKKVNEVIKQKIKQNLVTNHLI